MGLFGFGKKAVAAEVAGRNVTAHMIDADSCWEGAHYNVRNWGGKRTFENAEMRRRTR